MSDVSVADRTMITGADLGGPGGPDAVRCSKAAIDSLSRIAGPDMRLAQLQLDLSSHAIRENEVAITARIDKRTRSIVFASVEARIGSALIFRAQALFSKRSK